MSEEAAPPAAGQRRRLSPVSNPPSLPLFPQLQSNPVPSLYSTGLLETPVRNLQEGRNQMTSTPLGGQTLHGQGSNQSSAPLRSPLHAMLGRVNRHANLLQDKVDAYVRQKVFFRMHACCRCLHRCNSFKRYTSTAKRLILIDLSLPEGGNLS